jgi:hypothetical protein
MSEEAVCAGEQMSIVYPRTQCENETMRIMCLSSRCVQEAVTASDELESITRHTLWAPSAVCYFKADPNSGCFEGER